MIVQFIARYDALKRAIENAPFERVYCIDNKPAL